MHKFVKIVGPRKEIYNYEGYLLSKMYKINFPPNDKIQPNIKRVDLLSFEYPVDCRDNFVKDISPYNHGGAALKKKLYFLTDKFNNVLGLETAPPSLCKRKVKNPAWRDNINVFSVGVKKFSKGGKEMEKFYILVEGQRKYKNEFMNWTESREYNTQMPNFPGLKVPLIVNEISLFDISVFDSCTGQLLGDLTPHYHIERELPSFMKFFVKLGRKILGFNEPPKENFSINPKVPDCRKNLDICILGSKSDIYLQDKDAGILREMV